MGELYTIRIHRQPCAPAQLTHSLHLFAARARYAGDSIEAEDGTRYVVLREQDILCTV